MHIYVDYTRESEHINKARHETLFASLIQLPSAFTLVFDMHVWLACIHINVHWHQSMIHADNRLVNAYLLLHALTNWLYVSLVNEKKIRNYCKKKYKIHITKKCMQQKLIVTYWNYSINCWSTEFQWWTQSVFPHAKY